jgi:hypothetical protein
MTEEVDFYIDDNERKEKRETHELLNGASLEVRYYGTKKGCWDYSRGIISSSDGKQIADIKRNYGWFVWGVLELASGTWFVGGETYTGHTLVDLSSGDLFSRRGDGYSFCLTGPFVVSPDKTMVAIGGCHWASPYEWRLFNATTPSKGLKELEYDPSDDIPDEIYPSLNESAFWTKDNKFVIPKVRFNISTEDCDTLDDIENEDVKVFSINVLTLTPDLSRGKAVPSFLESVEVSLEREAHTLRQREFAAARRKRVGEDKILSVFESVFAAAEIGRVDHKEDHLDGWSQSTVYPSQFSRENGETNEFFVTFSMFFGRREDKTIRGYSAKWGIDDGDILIYRYGTSTVVETFLRSEANSAAQFMLNKPE